MLTTNNVTCKVLKFSRSASETMHDLLLIWMCVNRVAALTWPLCLAWLVSLRTSFNAVCVFAALAAALDTPAFWTFALRTRTKASVDASASNASMSTNASTPLEMFTSCSPLAADYAHQQEDRSRALVLWFDSFVSNFVMLVLSVFLGVRLACLWSQLRQRSSSYTSYSYVPGATGAEEEACQTALRRVDSPTSTSNRTRIRERQIVQPKELRLAAAIAIVTVTNLLVDGILRTVHMAWPSV